MVVPYLLAAAILAVVNTASSLNIPQKRQSETTSESLADAMHIPRMIASFKNKTQASTFKINGAKHLTLWYKDVQLPKQYDKEIIKDDIYYQTVRQSFPLEQLEATGKRRPSVFKRTIWDLPSNITILSLKLDILNEKEQPTGVGDGIFIHQAAINMPVTLLGFLEDCYNHAYIVPWVPNTPAVAPPLPGPDIFSPRDGSMPHTGFPNKGLREMEILELGVYATNLENRVRNLIAKIELDYVEGRPQTNSVKSQLSGSICEKVKLENDPKGGPKRFVLKHAHPMSVRWDGDIIAIEPAMIRGGVEYHVKVNDKLVCNSTAEYIDIPPNPHKGIIGAAPRSDIGRMSTCEVAFPIYKGDRIETEAYYDFDLHPVSDTELKAAQTKGVIPGLYEHGDASQASSIFVTFAQKPLPISTLGLGLEPELPSNPSFAGEALAFQEVLKGLDPTTKNPLPFLEFVNGLLPFRKDSPLLQDMLGGFETSDIGKAYLAGKKPVPA